MTTLERSVLGRLRRRGPLTPGGFSAQQLTDAGAYVVLRSSHVAWRTGHGWPGRFPMGAPVVSVGGRNAEGSQVPARDDARPEAQGVPPIPSVSLAVIAREWSRIGITGFGGPPAHIA